MSTWPFSWMNPIVTIEISQFCFCCDSHSTLLSHLSLHVWTPFEVSIICHLVVQWEKYMFSRGNSIWFRLNDNGCPQPVVCVLCHSRLLFSYIWSLFPLGPGAPGSHASERFFWFFSPTESGNHMHSKWASPWGEFCVILPSRLH